MQHQVIHGDCLEVLRSMKSGSVDAVVTDPPYGVGLKAKQHKWFRTNGDGYASYDDSAEHIEAVVIPALAECRRIARRVLVTPGIRSMWKYPNPDELGVVFNKSGTGMSRWGFTCAHPILYYGTCPYLERGMGSRPSSWEQPANDYAEKCDHPCPKPIGMMSWLVQRASLEGMTILDPFCGSGTTGVACVQTGRNFLGIEIDEKYAAIARRRIAEADAAQLFRPKAKAVEPPSLIPV